MPFATRRMAALSRSARRHFTTRLVFRWSTLGKEFPRNTSPTSSSGFTRSIKRGRMGQQAAASDYQSPRLSSSGTPAQFRSRARQGAPPSQSRSLKTQTERRNEKVEAFLPTTSLDVGKLVTDSPGRQYQFGVLGIAFDFPAQPADHCVDCSFGDVGVARPDPRQERGPAEDDSSSRYKQRQQIELLFGQVDDVVS